MPKFYTNFLAALMLFFMIGVAFFSMLDDSAIMDEVAHLPAGYSYIAKMDMRLNPEHPPLIKDLAGGAIWLWSKISGQSFVFPEQIPAWQDAINGQWDFGFDFMYKEGNNADLMLFLGRLPMLLILLVLGIYVFKWARELFGPNAALLALFLYTFSPTFLAHGRFVTTDVAAAAGIFIASYYFIRWLKNPTIKNLFIAGLIFGLAQLAKFSVFLLIPLFGFVVLVWIYLKTAEAPVFSWSFLAEKTWKYLSGLLMLFAIGYIFIVWPVYIFHTAKYPIARQINDATFTLRSFGIRPIANLIVWMSGIPILRALAQYGLGLAMVVQRAAGGNTTYFLGEVSAAGSRIYFPFMYLVKETITFHLLTLTAIFLAIGVFFKQKIYLLKNLNEFLNARIAEFLMFCFIALYWFTSIRSPLNIGVRHILPTFSFIFILITGLVMAWYNNTRTRTNCYCKIAFLAVLVLFQIFSVISVYPSFLAYFNELIGGPKNGYLYVTDSNLDWGQDLKRLAQWTDQNNIDRIYVDYFGGAIASYYLGDKFLPWWGTRSPQDLKENGGYLAVSATFLQGGRGKPAPGFKNPTGYYNWLNNYQLLTTIGHSIFIYYIPPEIPNS
jgi:hypothetical protein